MANFYDYGINVSDSDIDAALARREKVRPAPAQFVRAGQTGRWFKAGKETMRGKKTFFRAFIQPLTGTRRQAFNSAVTSEAPVARSLAHIELTFDWSDLSVFRHTVKWSMLQQLKHEDASMAVYNLVNDLYVQVGEDLKEQKAAALFQSRQCVMARVHTIYDEDGTTMSGISGHAAAFIRIKGGAITQFQKGMVLEVYDADGSTLNNQIVVHDVIHGEDGPHDSSVTSYPYRTASIGPGIVAEPCAADGSTSTGTGYDTTWDNSAQVTTASDYADGYIARSGEFSSSTNHNFLGLPEWFDPTVDVYDDADGSSIARDTTGYRWALPYIISAGSDGSEVDFDLDTHLGELSDNWITMVRSGWDSRARLGVGMRTDKSHAISIDRHLLMVCPPSTARWVIQTEATDTARFMSTAKMSEDAAKRLRRVGVVGFDGFVYIDPNLGDLVLQPDPQCTPYMVYILNPESWKWSAPAGFNVDTIRWNMNGNSRVWPIEGDTNGTPTFERQAEAYDMCYLYCDQMQANARIEYVKSGRL